jgi:hypothetical protein
MTGVASAARHTRTAPSISPRMMTGVPSDSAPRLEDGHARTHSITAVPPARRARRDLVHPGRDEPRRSRRQAAIRSVIVTLTPLQVFG